VPRAEVACQLRIWLNRHESPSSRARSAASARYAIDHAVDVMWGWMADDGTYETHSVVEFVAADTGQRWLVEVGSWADSAEESETAVDAPRGRAGDCRATDGNRERASSRSGALGLDAR
jgi:hypothetical protein